MRIGFIGDVHLASQAHLPGASSDLQRVLSMCDHVIANLEDPIIDIEQSIPLKSPVIKQTTAALALVKLLKIDVADLANNDMGDHGNRGIAKTLETLDAAGILFGGAGVCIDEIYGPLRLRSKNTTVSTLFGGENGFGCVSDDRSDRAGYAWLFHPRFWSMVRQGVDTSDFVVVLAHGGVEHMDRPLPQWRCAYRQLVQQGAAAVVAHHPHLTQGYELYRRSPTFFSIDKLCFNKPRPQPHWYHSQIPILQFKRGEPVAFELHHARFDLAGQGRILLDDTDAGQTRTETLKAELNSPESPKLVADDLRKLWRTRYGPCIDSSFNAFTSIRSVKSFIRRAIRSIVRGTPSSDPMMLEHLFDIESHRWSIAATMRLLRDGDDAKAEVAG